MEQVNDQSKVTYSKYKLGKIKSKYLIIHIVCQSDYLENCIPQFLKSSRLFQKLFEEQGKIFLRNGKFWLFEVIPREPNSLIKTFSDIQLIQRGLKGKQFKLEKLFDIAQDGDFPDKFHKKCDGIPHTLSVLHTDKDQIIGGYTKETWGNYQSEYRADDTAFVFSLTKHSLHPIQPEQIEHATYHQSRHFIAFGNVMNTDLYVGKYHKASQIGTSYMLPEGIEKGSQEARNYLAGSGTFIHTAFQTYRVLFI
ncbi:hypothetical protein FGO68_gene6002 [Halteria grandinella]|uniref:TLDc domain-containing protein n=1 Tax=Halteria grandinella TaxID=5974 RepID=A0A8J8NKK2_HALGN|nr:hypothetical protein FGO68_gene6002 [Halteria grandinella]